MRMINKIIQLIAVTCALIFFFWATGRAIDKTYENRMTRICDDAHRITREQKTLQRCQCYYVSADISCLDREGVSH